MRTEAKRWFEEAEADLRAAEDSLKAAHYNWACFQCQQSGEKALKAYLYNRGLTSLLTHSVKMLARRAGEIDRTLMDLVEPGSLLDMYYLATRYPNGLDREVAPSRYFDRTEAEKCLNSATLILTTLKKLLRK